MLFGITFIGLFLFQSDLANAPVPVDEEVILLPGSDTMTLKQQKNKEN